MSETTSDDSTTIMYDYKGEPIHPEDVGLVPIDELEGLVKRWETTDYMTEEANLMSRTCAENLRTLLTEHQNE